MTALGVLALTGFPRTQRVLMIGALLLALLTVLLDRSQTTPDADSLGWLLSAAAFLLLTFAAWNLLARPGDRWPYRVVIYTVYSASLQLMTLVAVPAFAAERLARAALTAGAIYAAASVVIVTLKPWLAKRMMRQRQQSNGLQRSGK